MYRVRFVYDEGACFEECNGEARPLTEEEYAEDYYNDKDGNQIPYAEYLRYYGNPDRHVYLGCVVERVTVCPCCEAQKVETAASLWGIDMMDDDTVLDLLVVGTLRDEPHPSELYTEDQIAKKTGYLFDAARELLQEAKGDRS